MSNAIFAYAISVREMLRPDIAVIADMAYLGAVELLHDAAYSLPGRSAADEIRADERGRESGEAAADSA